MTQQPPAVPSMTCVSVCCRQDMSTIRVWYWSFPSSPVCVLCNGCLCPIWSNMTRRIRTSFAVSTVVWRPSCTNGGAQLAPAPVARTHDQREERRATRSGAGRRSSMAGWWAVAGFLSCIYGCLHDGHVCHRVRQEDDPWLRAPGSRLSSSASASPLFLACCRCRRRRRI